MKRYKSVDEYIAGNMEWKNELTHLRAILSTTELKETVKWSMPTYTIAGKNVVGIGAFKTYVGLWFFQGVFMADPLGVLVNAQEGKTQAMRQWRFSQISEIKETDIIPYLEEAIGNQKAGLVVKPVKKPLAIPTLLSTALAKDVQLKLAFEQFSPGKQREFADYIQEAKRDQTKQRRLEKIIPMILSGEAPGDKYRK